MYPSLIFSTSLGVSKKSTSRIKYHKEQKKADKPSQSELGKFVRQWRDECLSCAVALNPTKILHPPKSWGRNVDQSYVCDLRDALYLDDSQPQHGEVVVFNADPTEVEAMLKGGDKSAFYKLKPYYLSGNHTGAAMCAIQELAPQERKWKSHFCTIFASKEPMDHPDTLRAIRGESDLQNKKHNLSRKVGFKEYFPKMVMEGREALKSSPENWDAIYDDWSARFGLDPKTLRLIWQTAKREGRVAELIMACITGVGVAYPKRFKKATSNTYFSAMASIPDERCISLLTAVVQCSMTLPEFHQECKLYKVEMKVRKVILREMKMDDWVKGQEEYPSVFDDQWVTQWVRTFEHLGKSQRKKALKPSSSVNVNEDGVPSKFLEELQERRDAGKKVCLSKLITLVCHSLCQFLNTCYYHGSLLYISFFLIMSVDFECEVGG